MKTINDAILLAQSLIKRVEGNKEQCAEAIKSHLLSAETVLYEMRDFLGGKCALDENSIKSISDGTKFDTLLDSLTDLSEFKIWAEQFNATVFQFKIENVYKQGQNYLEKNFTFRKGLLKGFLISIIIIAIFAAVFAMYGIFAKKDWANDFATILGIIDFTFGIIGFSIERISDMSAQKVSRSLAEIDTAQATDNSERANIAAKKCQIVIGNYNSQNQWGGAKVIKGGTVNQVAGDVKNNSSTAHNTDRS